MPLPSSHSAIDNLCDIIQEHRITRLPAPDENTATRWGRDKAARIREGIVIKDFESTDTPLIQAAIQEWKYLENGFLNALDTNGVAFDRWFSRVVKAWLQNNNAICKQGSRLCRVAGFPREPTTIHQVEVFGCILPRHVQTQQREIAECGYRMASIFYLECMGKHLELVDAGFSGHSTYEWTLNRAHSLWEYSKELYDQALTSVK